ncbi:hypothetical protein [Citreimonas sp.]|uniref:hypothetical protein n=1 Tax=Citreimonas sp. TaxID=3036715 RepID=UPI0040590D20
MTTVTTNITRRADFRGLVDAIAPKRFVRDPFGLFSGFRAYRVHAHLSGKSDAELEQIGLTRADLPRVAMEAVFDQRGR